MSRVRVTQHVQFSRHQLLDVIVSLGSNHIHRARPSSTPGQGRKADSLPGSNDFTTMIEIRTAGCIDTTNRTFSIEGG